MKKFTIIYQIYTAGGSIFKADNKLSITATNKEEAMQEAREKIDSVFVSALITEVIEEAQPEKTNSRSAMLEKVKNKFAMPVKLNLPLATIRTIQEIIKAFEEGACRCVTFNYEATEFFKNNGFNISKNDPVNFTISF